MGLTYKDSGVDTLAGQKQVELMKDIVKRTHNENVLSSIGGFAGLFNLDLGAIENPVLVSGTDGVGTKLKIAFDMDQHKTIGQDCVAMCVNDILCQGAKPLFFLDYIASGQLVPEKMAAIVEGVANGCLEGELALIGGETAEMPGFYQDGEYDIAGFAVGVVDKNKIIDGSKIKEGDRLLGLKSSGLHSNGYSLVRKIIFEKMQMTVDSFVEELGTSIGEEILKPTRIYTKTIMKLLDRYEINGICHITGGGFFENLPRLFSGELYGEINTKNIDRPKIFDLLQAWGNVQEEEMYKTFNMGIGMVLVVDPSQAQAIGAYLESIGEEFVDLGQVRAGERGIKLC